MRTQAESTRALGAQGWEVGFLVMDRHEGQPKSESVAEHESLDTWLQQILARGS